MKTHLLLAGIDALSSRWYDEDKRSSIIASLVLLQQVQ